MKFKIPTEIPIISSRNNPNQRRPKNLLNRRRGRNQSTIMIRLPPIRNWMLLQLNRKRCYSPPLRSTKPIKQISIRKRISRAIFAANVLPSHTPRGIEHNRNSSIKSPVFPLSAPAAPAARQRRRWRWRRWRRRREWYSTSYSRPHESIVRYYKCQDGFVLQPLSYLNFLYFLDAKTDSL